MVFRYVFMSFCDIQSTYYPAIQAIHTCTHRIHTYQRFRFIFGNNHPRIHVCFKGRYEPIKRSELKQLSVLFHEFDLLLHLSELF